MPEMKWRLASSFPKSIDKLYGAGRNAGKYVAEMTGQQDFKIRIFAAGEMYRAVRCSMRGETAHVEMGLTAGPPITSARIRLRFRHRI